MILDDLKEAADSVGIMAFITNSDSKIEVQLNALTKAEDVPILLINWNLEHSLDFTSDGFLENPSVQIVCLLMAKSPFMQKEDFEKTSFTMGDLYQEFLIKLNSIIISYQKSTEVSAISAASYTVVPRYGMGKHSGILGKFTMKARVSNCKINEII